ncbi:MAG: DUF3108 domain-containing protein [Gammaproteobacteria bacterium]
MTIASFLHRRRRVLVLCAASALLHYIAIGAVGGVIGTGLAPQRDEHSEPAPITATLLAPPPAAQPAPAPPPRMRQARAIAPPPAEEESPPAAPEPAPPEPVPEPAPLAAAAEAEVAPAPAAQPAEPAPQADTAPPEVQAPTYKVSLPPSAQLSFDVRRTDSKGEWKGSAEMLWKRSGAGYRIKVDASVTLMIASLHLATMTSEGSIDEYGLAPRISTEQRRGRAPTATHFDAAAKRVSFSASEQSWPITPGMQDKTSVQMQLAGIARADSGQLDAGVELMVAEGKGSMPYRFQLVGREPLDTAMGLIETVHLARPPLPGSYNARVDVWLAPGHHWLPVQVRNTESNGAVTTQTIRKIVVTDTEN